MTREDPRSGADDTATPTNRVLVVGSPRSGTTWTAAVLRRTAGAGAVDEPDTVVSTPFAARVRAGLASPDLGGPVRPGMEALWDGAWGIQHRGVSWIDRLRASVAFRLWKHVRNEPLREDLRRLQSKRMRAAIWLSVPLVAPQARHHIVRSVAATFAIEWLMDRYSPRVVVTRRHPLSVVASQLQRWNGTDSVHPERAALVAERFGVTPPDPSASRATVTAWLAGAQASQLTAVAVRHPEIQVVEHEVVCLDPVPAFRALSGGLGLEWTDEAERFLLASNAPGGLGEIRRVWSEQQDAWQGRLVGQDLDDAVRALAAFPIASRYAELAG